MHHVNDHAAIRSVTMHPFVSGALRYTPDQINSEGRAALLLIRKYNSQRAQAKVNQREDHAAGLPIERLGPAPLERKITLLRQAYDDPATPEDLRAIIATFDGVLAPVTITRKRSPSDLRRSERRSAARETSTADLAPAGEESK